LTSHSGLALVGMAINRHTDLVQTVTRSIPLHHGIALADVLKSYIRLLCLGKSNFEVVAKVREDEFFITAMNIAAVPSPETLRQRQDEYAPTFLHWVSGAASIAYLENTDVQCTALDTGHVPLDADVPPFDNRCLST